MRRSLMSVPILTLLVLGAAVRPAAGVTIDDLVNLKDHGLGDEILVALVETDGSIFHLSAADIVSAKNRGLSDAVLLAMINTAQKPDVVPPAPPVVIVQPPAPTVVTVKVPVQVPVEVPVAVAVPVAVPVLIPVRAPEPAPVYWGWGGQRRPDSWVPASEVKNASNVKPDAPPAKTP